MLIDLIYRMERELVSTLEREGQLKDDAGILMGMLRSKQQEIRRCRQHQEQIKEDLARYSAMNINDNWEAS